LTGGTTAAFARYAAAAGSPASAASKGGVAASAASASCARISRAEDRARGGAGGGDCESKSERAEADRARKVGGRRRSPCRGRRTYVDDHLLCDIDGQHLTGAAILGHDGAVWAQSNAFLQVRLPTSIPSPRQSPFISSRYGQACRSLS